MELLRRLRLTRAREVIKLGCTLATNKDAGGPDATGLGGGAGPRPLASRVARFSRLRPISSGLLW